MISQSRKTIELVVKTLLNEEKIHTETAKSILQALDDYEGELNDVLSKGVANLFEKAFNYSKVQPATIDRIDFHKEQCSGEVDSPNFKYIYTITRTHKR